MPDKQQDILKQIDKSIYDDAMGVTVFAFPQITAYSETARGHQFLRPVADLLLELLAVEGPGQGIIDH